MSFVFSMENYKKRNKKRSMHTLFKFMTFLRQKQNSYYQRCKNTKCCDGYTGQSCTQGKKLKKK